MSQIAREIMQIVTIQIIMEVPPLLVVQLIKFKFPPKRKNIKLIVNISRGNPDNPDSPDINSVSVSISLFLCIYIFLGSFRGVSKKREKKELQF